MVHGLSGTEDSAYMRASAAALLDAGHAVLRLNLRGAGPSRALCRLQYHAGRTGDLRDALAALDPALVGPGICLLGYSLGGNMALKFLAEHGAQFPILRAAMVSAPLDLAAAARRILERRNRFYHWNLLRWMQAESLGSGAALTVEEQHRITAARSIFEFDDRFVAPRNGYAGAAEYYAENSSRRFIAAVRVPTLVIHALDDPWIPPDAYRGVAWRENPNLVPLLTDSGGHVGFHGRGSPTPWHDQCVIEFFNVGPTPPAEIAP
jgi:predicted alpha/beta-fold hydrolase